MKFIVKKEPVEVNLSDEDEPVVNMEQHQEPSEMPFKNLLSKKKDELSNFETPNRTANKGKESGRLSVEIEHNKTSSSAG